MRFSSFLGWAVELNGTIFVQVFIFLSLLVWLSPTLFGPIMRLFEEREQRIDGAKRIAAELSGFADEKAKLFQIEYEKARTEARHTLTALKLEMEREYSESLDKVKATAREKMNAAEKELLEQETLIRSDLQNKTSAMASDIVKTMVRQSA